MVAVLKQRYDTIPKLPAKVKPGTLHRSDSEGSRSLALISGFRANAQKRFNGVSGARFRLFLHIRIRKTEVELSIIPSLIVFLPALAALLVQVCRLQGWQGFVLA